MVDCFGKSLQIGDIVVWTGKKGSGPIQCTIRNIMYGKACIEEVDELEWHITHWVTSVNIVKYSEAKQSKPGENLKEGDHVMYMYLGHCYWHPHLGTGIIKKVGPCRVTVYTDNQDRWIGRREYKTNKMYVTLDPSRVCKLN